jgi:hypothetical protein
MQMSDSWNAIEIRLSGVRERPSFAFLDYVTELNAHGHWMKDVWRHELNSNYRIDFFVRFPIVAFHVSRRVICLEMEILVRAGILSA